MKVNILFYINRDTKFKNHPLLGVGNKNYRVETCRDLKKDVYKKDKYESYICTTHPHQIYFELLSEHGLIGTLIILFILYKLVFSKISTAIKENNYTQIGSMIFNFNFLAFVA